MVFSGGDWSLCDEEGVTGHGKEVVAAGLSFLFFSLNFNSAVAL
jgi:hypothetical protein